MKQTAQVETKQAVEFGVERTLYRAIDADGWSSLWHSTPDKALEAWARRRQRTSPWGNAHTGQGVG